MTGTALVLVNEEVFMVLENIDKAACEELYNREKMVHFGKSCSILWSEEEIDWEYGY
ncbi:hypothetical protein [Ectobacillus panaciterrae]|uniref:hypothetical protein n=1 Tax=Ectobacillus panaciterrae TaxID=363872 RepID=UPI0003FD2EE4|nr:hypothetical protein [Ectobacillus panaciterrae]